MIDKFADMKGQLSELATVLNKFNSEAVQLRVLDLVFSKGSGVDPTHEVEAKDADQKASRKRTSKARVTNGNAQDKQKKSSSGVGARATLTQLLDKGIFDKPQTINSIIAHCKVNRARAFKQSDFSGSLARMVRLGHLVRKKNADHQYEYKKP